MRWPGTMDVSLCACAGAIEKARIRRVMASDFIRIKRDSPFWGAGRKTTFLVEEQGFKIYSPAYILS
jgi:hypothetical protein